MIDPRRHRNERIAASLIVLAAAALTAWAVWMQRRERDEVFRDVRYIPRQTKVTPEAELLRDYVRIDTSTPQGVQEGARWLQAQLAKHGIRAELIESSGGRFNVYARIKGRQPGEGLLLFNHIDVVPPGDGWKKPPFSGDTEFNQMYGRGTLDMKGTAITQLLAFIDVARSGSAPVHDLVFLATGEEELGGKDGMVWLLEHRPDIFENLQYGVTEGGLTEVLTEKITFFGIEIGGKQMVYLALTAPSDEPLRQARFVLERYVLRREADRVLPGVREYFRDVAPTRVTTRTQLEDIDASIRRGDVWKLPAGYRDFLQDSLWVGVPAFERGQWIMPVRMNNLPDSDPEERIAWLKNVVAKHGVGMRIDEKNGPVPLSPTDTPVFRALAGEAKKLYGVQAGVQVIFKSGSDCRFLRVRGMACYGVAPFLVDIFQSNSIHHRDERVRLDWFSQGVVYMRRAVTDWAGMTER